MKFIICLMFLWHTACLNEHAKPDLIYNGKELDMHENRATHTATLLTNDKVLITGGFDENGSALSSAEIFDPVNKTFTLINPMNTARLAHTATLLPGGKVLITGGFNNGEYIADAELFDPVTQKFTSTGIMIDERYGHVAVLLNTGKVLIAGGVGKGWTFLSSAEIYDPASGLFYETGNMIEQRESHTATLLPNGNVLITGGHKGRRQNIIIYNSSELYDPVIGNFTLTGNLNTKRHKHDAVLLPDGNVLVNGGSDERDEQGQYNTAELYNYVTGEFNLIAKMNTTRYKHQGTSLRLNSGRIVLTGGADLIEFYNYVSKDFSKSGIELTEPRLFAASVLLSDGQVLLTGGYGQNIMANRKAVLFRP